MFVGLMMMTVVWTLKDITRPYRSWFKKKPSQPETSFRQSDAFETESKDRETPETNVDGSEPFDDSSGTSSDAIGIQEVSSPVGENPADEEDAMLVPPEPFEDARHQEDGSFSDSDELAENLSGDVEVSEDSEFPENDSGGSGEDGEAAADETGEQG